MEEPIDLIELEFVLNQFQLTNSPNEAINKLKEIRAKTKKAKIEADKELSKERELKKETR